MPSHLVYNNSMIDLLKTHAEAIVYERYKHMILDRYHVQLTQTQTMGRAILFFADGSYRTYEVWLDHKPCVYCPRKSGRFRNKRTGRLIEHVDEYSNATYIALI